MLCRLHGESRTTSRRWTTSRRCVDAGAPEIWFPHRSHERAATPSRRATQTHRDVFDVYTSMNEQLLAVARDACVELMRSGLRAQNLAPSLFASVKLASSRKVAVGGLVSDDSPPTTGNRRKESPVTASARPPRADLRPAGSGARSPA